jgi:hypothetical protein
VEQLDKAASVSAKRLWIASATVVVVVAAVWKFIDWRMQPPPPASSGNVATAPPR